MLDAGYANLSELARLAGDYAGSVQEDPERLAQVERRRDLLSRLSGKYGATLSRCSPPGIRPRKSWICWIRPTPTSARLAARRVAAEGALRTAADALSIRRREAADRLVRGVNRLLPQLGLPGGKLSVELVPLPEPGAHGQESVQLNVQLNVGLEAKPLAKVASGGELSRLMLALKVVLVKHDAIATLVFDEVDQGIGGETGAQVGSALAEVAERHQVLVITHLPQIAARADGHLVVSKQARARDRHQRRAGTAWGGPGKRDRADAGRHGGGCGATACAGAVAHSGSRETPLSRHHNPKYIRSLAWTRCVSGTRPFFDRTTRS